MLSKSREVCMIDVIFNIFRSTSQKNCQRNEITKEPSFLFGISEYLWQSNLL